MRSNNETTLTILVRKIRFNGALAGKEEPLHSWVPRFNHELDEQKQQLGSNNSLFRLGL